MTPTAKTCLFLFALPALLLQVACTPASSGQYEGYVEGEYLYLAAPEGGYLKTLDVLRGTRAASGQRLFAVASDPDDEALAEAQARAGSAKEKLENLKQPRRPPEIAALEANLRAAEAAVRLTSIQLQQQEALKQSNFVAQSAVDAARSASEQAVAQVDAARQQLETYRITLGRQAEVRGAAADLDAANAQTAQKQWVVDRKAVSAPEDGEITETYYRPGEWVPAGSPVASLLPDTRRRLRFFVPETALATLKPGDMIQARCDGCATPIRAKVDFISAQAEYTPPIIYSRGSREKLVFRVEATPPKDQAQRLRPGLPIDVSLEH